MNEGSEDHERERPGAQPEGDPGAQNGLERAEREWRHEDDSGHEHHHGHGEHHHQSGDFEIKVNGRTRKVCGERQDYRDIAAIAYPNPDFTKFLYTITYLNGIHGASGDLVEGETIEIKNGMVFNVRRSDKS